MIVYYYCLTWPEFGAWRLLYRELPGASVCGPGCPFKLASPSAETLVPTGCPGRPPGAHLCAPVWLGWAQCIELRWTFQPIPLQILRRIHLCCQRRVVPCYEPLARTLRLVSAAVIDLR